MNKYYCSMVLHSRTLLLGDPNAGMFKATLARISPSRIGCFGPRSCILLKMVYRGNAVTEVRFGICLTSLLRCATQGTVAIMPSLAKMGRGKPSSSGQGPSRGHFRKGQ